MRNSILNLIEYSIWPATFIALGKFIGFLTVIRVKGLNWSFADLSKGILNAGTSLPENVIKEVNSYSDLIMYIFIASYFSIVVIKAVYFHDKHIDPKRLIKLAKNNLLNLVETSYNLYHLASVSLLYLWLAQVIIFVNTVYGKSDLIVLLLTFLFSSILTLVLLKDLTDELEQAK